MTFRELCQKAAKGLRDHDPVIRSRYDLDGDFFRNRKEGTPVFSYALRGEVQVDRRRILTALALMLAAFACFCGRGKRRRK